MVRSFVRIVAGLWSYQPMAKKRTKALNDKSLAIHPLFPAFPDETTSAYRAWSDYLEMGPERSMKKIAERYIKDMRLLYCEWKAIDNPDDPSLPKTDAMQKEMEAEDARTKEDIWTSRFPPAIREGTIEEWSSDYGWQSRLLKAEEYFLQQKMKRLLSRQDGITELTAQMVEEMYNIYQEVVKEIPRFKTRRKTIVTKNKDGKAVEETIVTIALNVGDYLQLDKWRRQLMEDMRTTAMLPNHYQDKGQGAEVPVASIYIQGLEVLSTPIIPPSDAPPAPDDDSDS